MKLEIDGVLGKQYLYKDTIAIYITYSASISIFSIY